MLVSAPQDHILVKQAADPVAFEQMLKERPADFVKEVLKSYGDMPITRLEDVCVANGFVKSVNWKKFWESARTDLRKDVLVEIPAKRADPIRLKAAAEDYGDSWLTAFSHETDPKLILASVREYVAQNKFKAADDSVKAKIEEMGLLDKWNACSYIQGNNPTFVAAKPMIADFLGMTEKQLDDWLSKCVY